MSIVRHISVQLVLHGARTGLAWAAFLLLTGLTGCTGLFFYPDASVYSTPAQIGVKIEEVRIPSAAGALHGWWLPAEQPRGSILFLHGNAENLTSHVLNVAWLPSRGYNVLIFDYRGYGQSPGHPDLPGVIEDSRAAFEWLDARAGTSARYVLGQSLGGALAIRLVAEPRVQCDVQALVVDAAFASYPGIFREKLADIWLTWPFQYPLSWLIPGGDDPIEHVARINVPLLVIHSRQDLIVPFHHGQQLFERAAPPRQLLATETPHGATFMQASHRQALLDFLQQHREWRTACRPEASGTASTPGHAQSG